MLSKKLQEAINAQINAEYWSAFLYLSMSADFSAKGLPGFANWMEIQFQEEQSHGLKFLNYMLSRGAHPELRQIDKVQNTWKTPLDAFKDALAHEQVVTKLINDIYALATEEKDYATQSMLKWFIDEQVEEEESVQAIIDTLTLVGDNGYGIYQLDKELQSRTFVPIAEE
ncbi:MAG: ferritin [Bacteroidales bacterium]|nr:ferritin [Bacteroidales bacterium]MDD4685191.1 ferritin [Bacteroidales bacterium]